VLDPNESSDIRLIQLQMELEEPGPKLTYAVVENRLLFLLPMLVLAERRVTEPQIAVLRQLSASMKAAQSTPEMLRLRSEFWLQIAKATDNPLFQQQVRWFGKLLDKLGQRGPASASRGTFPADFYDKLVESLAAHGGAVDWYLKTLGPILDWADARKAKSAAAALGK
jgi:DNA-binding FadR family transcriptional regulator